MRVLIDECIDERLRHEFPGQPLKLPAKWNLRFQHQSALPLFIKVPHARN